ncbi:MAG: DUF4386 family protein [Chloroflexi bacterium]|nr:DUF4386 family protein [Chloroflexota bacterium]
MDTRSLSPDRQALARLGGYAGIVAALWLPLFVALFFVIMPARGLDINRFGEPQHVLPFFAAQPALIRLAGLFNMVGLSAAALFGLILARMVFRAAPGQAVAGGFLTTLGWLLTLIAETLDLAAYVALPALYARDQAAAAMAFVTLQTAGRMIRTWGYMLVALGVAALGWGMLRDRGWPRGLGFLGVAGAAAGMAMFVLEYVFVTQTGDAGGGMAQAFTAMFVVLAILVTIWHGWGGLRLLKRRRSAVGGKAS